MTSRPVFDAKAYTEVCEGQARILFPTRNEVFYNPVQEFNRDLSCAVIQQFVNIRRREWQLTPQRNKRPGSVAALRGTALPIEDEDDDDDGDDDDGDGAGGERSENASHDEHDEGEGGSMATEVSLAVHIADESSAAAAASSAVGVAAVGGGAAAVPATEFPGITILEALSATGLRAVRYFKEIEGVARVVANDFSPDAVDTIAHNVRHNGLDPAHQVVPNQGDATIVMLQYRAPVSARFDVIDLDPYGSPTQFLDAALSSVAEGGLLCVTCTDMAVLAGNHGEACFAKYGAYPLHGKFCHEMALRIVLACLATHAARHRRYIVPLMSASIDFYNRIFIRVFSSAVEMKKTATKLSYVYMCTGCESFHFQPVGRTVVKGTSTKYKAGCGPAVGQGCVECGASYIVGGPVWNQPIHDQTFVAALLDQVKASTDKYTTSQRMIGLITLVSEELPDAPLYYTPAGVSNTLHCVTPPQAAVRSALLHLGHRVSNSHAHANALKTDAPAAVVWDVMRAWVAQNPVKNVNPLAPGTRILSRASTTGGVSFAMHADGVSQSKRQGLSRYPDNPTPNWGPKARAGKRSADGPAESLEHKRRRLQNHRAAKVPREPRPAIRCHYFFNKEGGCTDGVACRFSHDPASKAPVGKKGKKKAAVLAAAAAASAAMTINAVTSTE